MIHVLGFLKSMLSPLNRGGILYLLCVYNNNNKFFLAAFPVQTGIWNIRIRIYLHLSLRYLDTSALLQLLPRLFIYILF